MKKSLLFAISLIFFFLYNIKSHAQWEWQNPSPIGNDLNDIHFINDSTGFAVADFGYLLRTNTAGEKWFIQEKLTTNDLLDIYFLDSLTGFIIGTDRIILKTEDGGNNWTEDEIPGSCNLFYSIDFLNDSLGWIAGSGGYIYKTLNGGQSWIEIESTVFQRLRGIYCTNDSTVWVVGDKGTAIKTTDGGTSWTPINLGLLELDLNGIYFLDENNGLIIADDDRIYRTANGGETWGNYVGSHWGDLLGLHFIDDHTGYVVGTHSLVKKTENGGNTWEYLVYEEETWGYTFNGLFVKNDSTFWVAGKAGLILKGNELGEYEKQTTFSYKNNRAICFTDTLHGWVGSSQQLLYTNDGGNNWNEYELENVRSIFRLQFLDTLNGWLVAMSPSQVMKTNDGGLTWAQLVSIPLDSTVYDLCMVDYQNGWLCGENGYLARTVDGGNTWINIDLTLDVTLFEFYFTDSQHGWIIGENGTIFSTKDGGLEWSYQTIPTDYLSDIFFIDQNTGWIVGGQNNVWKTINGGLSWERKTTQQWEYSLHSVFFIDEFNGWTGGSLGIIHSTTDGGETWTSDNILSGYINCIVFPDASQGWICGTNSSILKHNEVLTVSVFDQKDDQYQQNHEVLFYPNPAKDVVRIEGEAERYTIYNLSGQLLQHGKVEESIDVSILQPGVYIIDVDGVWKKLVVE